jgi:hypothetical protein
MYSMNSKFLVSVLFSVTKHFVLCIITFFMVNWENYMFTRFIISTPS